MTRSIKAAAATLGLVVVLAGAAVASGALTLASPPSSAALEPAAVVQSSSPGLSPSASPSPSPTSTPTPTPVPTPTPTPTPVLVPAPLTGRLVTERDAAQHPIAVMIDDAPAARPQSGFNAASVVWQAPAEGGIPRYMVIFQDTVPAEVGPVRSARYYYIGWAAEWNAVYGHVGGSPQAMATLRAKGSGQLVYNADEFRWGGTYYRRISDALRPAQRVFGRRSPCASWRPGSGPRTSR